MSADPHSLPADLRHPIGRQLEVDLASIRVARSRIPRSLGALALASGDEILIDPAVDALSAGARRQLLAHEVAHVLQQRQGRVAPTGLVAGIAVNDDPQLELEAEAFAREFVEGRRLRFTPGSFGRAPSRDIAQCIITIGGVRLKSVEQLSEKAQLLLKLIPGSVGWLNLYILVAKDEYHFASERALLDVTTQALTDSGLMFIPGIGLSSSPAALLQIEETEDLQLLLDYKSFDPETEDDPNPVFTSMQVSRTLSQYRLRPDRLLIHEADRLIRESGVEQVLLFRTLGLGDLLRLYDLINGNYTPALSIPGISREAAYFARSALSVPDWVAWFQLYIESTNGIAPPVHQSTLEERETRARLFCELLIEPCTPWIRCPQCSTVDFQLSSEDLLQAVRDIVLSGGRIYFGSLAGVMYHVVKHTDIKPDSPDPVQIVDTYCLAAQALIASKAATVTIRFDQSPVSRSIVFETPTAKAVVKVLLWGDVLLATYFEKKT